MAKGLLISFAGFPVSVSSLFPDNGLASLAGNLIANGHEVKILDYNSVNVIRQIISIERANSLANQISLLSSNPTPETLQSLIELDSLLEQDLWRVTDDLAGAIGKEIESQRSNFVGFKLWSGYGFLSSVRIADKLRQNYPYLKIFGGGPAVLYSEDAIFSYTKAFTVLVDGEGDETILKLAEYADGKTDLRQIPNLIFCENGSTKRTQRYFKPNLNDLPPPNYDLSVYPSLAGDNHIKIFIIDESRGCPMKCPFCIHQYASGNKWRVKSVTRVLNEIMNIGSNFGSYTFRLSGSFTPNNFISDFIRSIPTNNHFRFSSFSFPKGLSRSKLESLAYAGCKSLFFGVESFDDTDLKRLGKRSKSNHIQFIITSCLDAGIVPGISLIIPAPGQTKEALEYNRQMAIKLCSNKPATVMTTFPALIPRTQWWNNRELYGFNLTTTELAYRKLLPIYKIRRMLPTSLWEPLPYTVNGRDFQDYSGTCAKFQKDLILNGVIVDLQDEGVLVADALNISLAETRKKLATLFFTLHPVHLDNFVKDLNKQICHI